MDKLTKWRQSREGRGFLRFIWTLKNNVPLVWVKKATNHRNVFSGVAKYDIFPTLFPWNKLKNLKESHIVISERADKLHGRHGGLSPLISNRDVCMCSSVPFLIFVWYLFKVMAPSQPSALRSKCKDFSLLSRSATFYPPYKNNLVHKI